MKNTAAKLFNRNFLLLWQGQFVSQIGNQAYLIALMFWIKHATGSASLMGLVLMVSQIPAVLLGPLAGAFADNHSRKKIIVLSDLINGFVVLGIGGLIFIAPDQNELIISSLFIVGFITSSTSTFFQPAIQASIPELVPKENLAAANSMNQFSVQFSTFIGQSSGGVLYRIIGAPFLFLIDGFTFIFSAISEMFISIPQKIEKSDNGHKNRLRKYLNDMKIGFTYIYQRPGMRLLYLAAAFINFFLTPFFILLPFYVEDKLGLTTDWYGFIMAAFGLGAVLGYFIAGTIKTCGKTRSLLTISSLIFMSFLLGVLGVTDNKIIAMVSFFLAGITNGYLNINILTILQLSTPSELRGRVFGVRTTLSSSLTPVSMGLSGIIFDMIHQDISLLFTVCAVLSIALSCAVASRKSFRDFMAYE